tara:strand:- start:1035 stop:1631 length:597 start_codon:yes stop_codon:yes gene_type:complete
MKKKIKVAITGHTSGIGKAIFDLLKDQKEYEVFGFSRSNGWDLEEMKLDPDPKKPSMDRFYEEIEHYDIFINNAYHEFMQVELLFGMYDYWRKRNKTIINISSVSADKSKGEAHKYQIHKVALDKACLQLETMGKCKIVNIRPGWVDTPIVQQYKKYVGLGIKMLEPKDVADVVWYVLQLPRHIHIKNLSIEPWYNEK